MHSDFFPRSGPCLVFARVLRRGPWGMGMGQWDPAMMMGMTQWDPAIMMMQWQQLQQQQLPQQHQCMQGNTVGMKRSIPLDHDAPGVNKRHKAPAEEGSDLDVREDDKMEATPRSPTSPCPTESQEDDKAKTPPIIRKLLSLAAERNETISRDEAVSRLSQLAKEAEKRMSESKDREPLSVAAASSHDSSVAIMGQPVFKRHQAVEAKRAIQGLIAATSEALKNASCTAHTVQLNVKFVQPVSSAAELRAEIENFHGASGPTVVVQPLDGSSWKNPSSTMWFAEKKGDARNCVFRLNVPAEGAARKAQSISFQVAVGGRALTIKTSKALVAKYGGNMIMQFGPHQTVTVAQTTSTGLDLNFGGQGQHEPPLSPLCNSWFAGTLERFRCSMPLLDSEEWDGWQPVWKSVASRSCRDLLC